MKDIQPPKTYRMEEPLPRWDRREEWQYYGNIALYYQLLDIIYMVKTIDTVHDVMQYRLWTEIPD